jgi:hypothetical protein
MRSFRPFIKQRAALAALAALLALGIRLSTARPPPRTLVGLAHMLGHAAGGVVSPKDIAWEPSPGFLAETFVGRRVLFLSAPHAGEPRDLYRALVRVTLAGQPVSVEQLRDITQTPIGDDVGLQVRGTRAVFATVAYGRIQGITTLDLSGIRSGNRPHGLINRLLLAVTEFQRTGSLAGLGRTDIVLDVPARHARLDLDPPLLRIGLGERSRDLVYNVERRTLRGAGGGQPYAARAIPEVHPPKPLVLWGVDTVRAEVGPAPITWLENKVFGAQDTFKRATFQLFSSKEDSALRDGAGRTPELDASKMSAGAWPPHPIPSLWKNQKPGEGQWKAVEYPWLKRMPHTSPGSHPPAYFYRTFIRPDTERPYSEVEIVAMDMRQLELGMQAGFEDPKPLTGPPGDGRLPRDPAIESRVVATFNGAFKTEHGKYGMMVNHRVLLPPVKGAATVVVTDTGDTGLGSWPQTETIPENLVSFRQNLDPLVEDGKVNPTGRYIWGWQLAGTSVMTQRTAICVTAAGQLYYAWGKAIDGPTLGKALRQAGCSYGIHLDMNPAHSGFVFTDVRDPRAHEYTLKKLDPGMKIPADKFVRWSAKDFFYMMVRDPVPGDPSGIRWVPDGGQQPPPTWMPGVFKGSLPIGTLPIQLLSFEPGRVDWQLCAGTKEPTSDGAGPKHLELTGDDAHRVIAAIGMGHTTEATSYGLAFGNTTLMPLRSSYATVVISPGKTPRVVAPGETPSLAPGEEAVQLPLLADDGRLVARGRDHGALRMRGAFCVTPNGRVIIARARHDSSDPVATALLRTGCRRVMSLDRGSRHPSFVHRTGSDTPPVSGYETTVLYALGRPMTPHAFRWKPKGSKPSTRPTGYDYPPQPKKKKKK